MAYQPTSREAQATFRGRCNTFRTPGRAGTTGQKIMSIYNPAGSNRAVILNQMVIDLYQTVIKAVGTPPPLIRAHRITVAPTNGTVLTRVAKDTALPVANSVVEIRGDAASDGNGSATTLTQAIAVGGAATTLTQEYAPRLITAVGYEMFDRTELLEGKEIFLRPGEGILLFLDYTIANSNPTTDMWMAGMDWFEYPI
jgi:hypothetical protein